jgi:crotonobetainyl-CoA:carnitine CoA-transferase CaiB-like acyl-CoA transferase
MARPLEGLRVLDLSHVMAGPVCAMMLADLGADVIKIEKGPAGDDSRKMAPPWVGADEARESAAFMMVNRNKRGIVLDLKSVRGKADFLKLVDGADVLVENFRAGALDKLGLGFTDLHTRNPRLVYCAVSGFGRTGPQAAKGGYDLMAQALTGHMSFTGEGEGRPPVKSGAPIADITAGLLAAIGVLAALQMRERTGRGQMVDTSLLEAGAILTYWQSAMHLADGRVAKPMGSAHPLDGPYQAFKAADGWLTVGAANQANWLRLVEALEAPHLAHDPRFADNPARMAHLAALVEALTPLFRRRTRDAWIARLEAHGVPTAPVLDIGEALAHPQLAARDMLPVVPHATLGEVRTLGCPIKFSHAQAGPTRGAPTLGQHTAEVLADILAEAPADGAGFAGGRAAE